MERISPSRNIIQHDPKRPYINFFIIRKYTLRCKVLKSAFRSINLLLVFPFGRKPEVTYLNLIFLVDKDVIDLDIAMDDVLLVDVRNSFGNLLCDFSDFVDWHAETGIIFKHVSLQIALFTVLQNDVVVDLIVKLVVHLKDESIL